MSLFNTITPQHVADFLKKEYLGTVSTVNVEGKPNAATIYFLTDEDFNIFFLTKKNSHKCKNIETQNEVVLTITDPGKKETLSIHGKASIEPNNSKMIKKMTTFLSGMFNQGEKFDIVLPILEYAGIVATIRIEPYEFSMSSYSQSGLSQKVVTIDELRKEEAKSAHVDKNLTSKDGKFSINHSCH